MFPYFKIYHHQELVKHVRGRSSNIWSTAMHPSTSPDLTKFVFKLLSNSVFTQAILDIATNFRIPLPPRNAENCTDMQSCQSFVCSAVPVNCKRGSKSENRVKLLKFRKNGWLVNFTREKELLLLITIQIPTKVTKATESSYKVSPSKFSHYLLQSYTEQELQNHKHHTKQT